MKGAGGASSQDLGGGVVAGLGPSGHSAALDGFRVRVEEDWSRS